MISIYQICSVDYGVCLVFQLGNLRTLKKLVQARDERTPAHETHRLAVIVVYHHAEIEYKLIRRRGYECASVEKTVAWACHSLPVGFKSVSRSCYHSNCSGRWMGKNLSVPVAEVYSLPLVELWKIFLCVSLSSAYVFGIIGFL